MRMSVNEQILTACLLFKWHNFSLPYSRSFMNIQILPDVHSYEEKIKLAEKYKDLKLQILLDVLSTLFNIKLHLIYYTKILHSGDNERELYIRINSHCFIFHEHIGKLVKLPSGLGKTTRAIHKLGDMIKHKFGTAACNMNYSLSLESKFDEIEKQLRNRIDIWKKKMNGKSQLIRRSKKNYSKKLNLHYDTVSQKLFLILNDKQYFRGELKHLKLFLI